MTRYKVLVTCRQMQETLDRYRPWFEERGIEVSAPTVVQQMDEQDLLPIIGGFDGIIAGDDDITARVIDAADRLKVICKWGVGVDAIDISAAEGRNIPVFNTPGMFGDEVADVAMGYAVMLARGLHLMDQAIRRGEWHKIRGDTLSSKTLGIVGLGSIGRAVARRAKAFGMHVIGTDLVSLSERDRADLGADQYSLDHVLACSDYIVLACPHTRQTHHMIAADSLGRMRSGARLINVSRGPLIDETALIDALERGTIGGAALDVFEVEPLPASSKLRTFENVILGSHNGSNTWQGVLRVNDAVLANLERGLFGLAQ